MTPGIKELLFGPPGSGKSHSIRTLLEADPNLQVFCLFTEPSGMTILGDTPIDRLHWNYIAPSQAGFSSLQKQAEMTRDFSVAKLFDVADPNRAKYAQFIDVLKQLSNFHCTRCSKDFGSVDTWQPDRALVLDSLSGLNLMAKELVTGGKTAMTLPEWGVAIDHEAKLINMLTLGCQGHFVLIAHIDREIDQVLGGTKILPAALGKKLPQEIGRFFDDVIYSSLAGTKFQWSTIADGADAKARILPLNKELIPSFKPVIERWKLKGGIIPTPATLPTTGAQS